jgi:bacillithiol biosynthesis cysteine-adding enzyme BshC
VREIVKIALKEAPVLGATAKKYLLGELKSLHDFSPDEEGIRLAIEKRKNKKVNREVLVKILSEQNSNANAKAKSNILLLKNENAFTVTTGHQLCLFTGPLYFIYKILHTIKLSEDLKKKFPENDFVPVYWMASEDHDFEEVSGVSIFGKSLKWNSNIRGGVGRVSLQADCEYRLELQSVLSELKSILGESEKAKEIYSVIEKCYSQENLSEATRMLVDFLMGEYGIVIIDADEKELKKEFVPVFIKEIEEEFVLSAVNESSEILIKQGLKAQVTPREINIFYLQENSRERIIRDNEVYVTADYSKNWDKEALLEEIKNHPERFSPNVLMRAMYQETILPNICYVGGGGEISYWLQMKKMFEAATIFFPVLKVRNSFLLVDAGQQDKISKLGFSVMDFFKKEEDLINQYIDENKTAEIDFVAEQEKLKKVFGELADKIAVADATLRATTEAELQKALKSLEILEARVRKAEKQKHDQSLTQIKNIKAKLFPEGEFQERHDNFLSYWLKTEGKLIEELYGMMEGMESELRVVV